MLARAHQQITNAVSLKASVITDPQVCFWVSLLLSDSRVKREIDQDLALSVIYRRWQMAAQGQTALAALFLAAVGLFLRYPEKVYLVLAVVAAVIFLFIEPLKRKELAKLFVPLVQRDFPQDLTQRSLYQISEFYGRKYHLAGMAELVAAGDQFSRNVFLFLAVMFLLVYSLPGAFLSFVAIPGGYILANAILKPIFLRRRARIS